MERKELFPCNGWIEFKDDSRCARSINGNTTEKLDDDHFLLVWSKILIFTQTQINTNDPNFIIVTYGSQEIKLYKCDINIIFTKSKEALWVNEDYMPVANTTLCGNWFIGEYLVISNPEDLAFGDVLERKCENCFFKPTHQPKRCDILPGKGNWRPRTLFRRRKNENMVPIIDQKQVAQYCKYFTHWDAE